MSNTLHVTNVPILVDLRVLLAPYGTVRESRMVTISGANGGAKTALVEMDSPEAAAAAVAALDGRLHAGMVMRVCLATARHETDADHTSLFGPMNMTVDVPPRGASPDDANPRTPAGPESPQDPVPRRTSHAWFSIESASRYGSEVFQRIDGATVKVTRVDDLKDYLGSFRSDEKYLGEVMRREDGGCVRAMQLAHGCTG